MSHFNKQVGKHIDREKSDKLRKNWKAKGIVTESSFIGSEIIMNLLSRPGAVGLKICYGLDDEGNMQPVLFGCDDKGNAIHVSEGKDGGSASGGADASIPCPPYCGGTN
jgi:hypothetical protein